jgi:hypothetical protein
VLTERQIRLLQLHRRRTVDPEQHVEAPYPGYLLCQDTYFVGTIKGVGKIYMQSVVDAHCSLAFATLALSKAPMTAVDTLYSRVLPFYEEHGADVERVLTDNGREYCGRPLQHFYELFLALNQIEHHRTEVRSPETNGFCERFHRTVKEEFFTLTFRKTFHAGLDPLQAHPDRYLDFYNRERARQGYCTKGRTPRQAFPAGLALRPHREAA